MTTKAEVLAAARALTADERWELIEELEQETPDPAMTPEMRAEFDRRWDDYKSGRVRALSVDEVMQLGRKTLEKHG